MHLDAVKWDLIGVRLTVDVLPLVDSDVTNGKFTVGGLSGAVTAGEIVDDESSKLVARNLLQGVLEDIDLGAGITSDWSVTGLWV